MWSGSIRGRGSSTIWWTEWETGNGKRETGRPREAPLALSAIPRVLRLPPPVSRLPSSWRHPDDALWILVAGFRRLAPQRPRRADGDVLGLRQPPRSAQRRDRVRPDAHRR